MKLSLERKGDRLLVRVPGPRLDADAAQEFRDALVELMQEDPAPILLDLSAVSEVDSAGIAALASALKRARRSGGTIEICALQPAVREILELTLLDRMLPIQNSRPV